MGSSSPQQMPPPPDSTFSAAESITTHDTLPPSKLIARDNVLFTGLLAAFAPSMAEGFLLFFDVPAAGSVGDTPQVRAILHARSIVEACPPSE